MCLIYKKRYILRKKCAQEIPKLLWFQQKCQQFCRKKYANFPQKYANIRKSAQIGISSLISSLLRFMNVANRIKSQLEGTKLVMSETDACFKESILKYSEYSCMCQALNLWAPITNTNSANLGTQGYCHQQIQWLNCQHFFSSAKVAEGGSQNCFKEFTFCWKRWHFRLNVSICPKVQKSQSYRIFCTLEGPGIYIVHHYLIWQVW